jgi:DMSO reductase anchor subunit
VSVGALLADLVWPRPSSPAVAVATAVAGLGASLAHLGRPRYAYRAVIGIGHSWLSREVVAFSAFVALTALYALGRADHWSWTSLLGLGAASTGVAGLAASVMVYASTHRADWSIASVATRFSLTAAVGGVVAARWAASIGVINSGAVLLVLAVALVERTQFFAPASPTISSG